jgi:hypothetical protein
MSFSFARTQGLSFGMASESVRAFLDGPGGSASPTRTLYPDDPRIIAISPSDLPDGGNGWTRVDGGAREYPPALTRRR